MARKSRKNLPQPEQAAASVLLPELEEAKMPAAIYGRLSVEDEETEESMETQIALVQDYINRSRELSYVDTYFDNGFTGTNFKRPAFTRLMNDVRQKKIKCIVVKDLSRFGRNYLEAGYYIETVFPFLGIRLIAVTDNFDSTRKEDMESLALPIRNMVNAMYAKDISKKIWTSLQRKKEAGYAVGNDAPYGYIRNSVTKRNEIDPEAAFYVQLIFQWELMGVPIFEIARRMTLLQVPTPREWHRKMVEGKEVLTCKKWGVTTIRHILENQTYVGDTINNKSTQKLFAGQDKHDLPKEQWYVAKNTHPAIIARADGDLGKDGKDKSNSIENQKELIQRYISCKESLQNVPVMDFVDDGYTGSNFDRPGFQQMMDGVRNGKIDTIIVKDLSRFGRDYIGVGEYMEQIFPLLGVRLIAINDNYDSNNYKGTTLGMDVVVSNLVNTMYCRDAGKKLRTANQVKWRKGITTASAAPFGYQFDPDKKGAFIIDLPAAKIVRRIFDLAILGLGTREIAMMLNDENVPVPSVYNKENKAYGKETTYTIAPVILWDSSRVWKILTAYVYTGAMVLGKTKTLISGKSIVRTVPKGQQFITEGTHEAIVSREEFEKAQLVIKSNSHKVLMGRVDFPLKGKVRCGNCRRVMAHNFKQVVPTFWCREGLELVGQTRCTSEIFRVSDIESAVFQALKKELSLLDSLYGDIQKEEQDLKEAHKKANRRKTLMEQELKNLKGEKMRMYEEYAAGTLPLDTYKQKKQECDRRISEVEEKIELEKGVESTRSAVPGTVRAAAEQAENFLHGTRLTAGMVSAFIENVFVHDGGRIVVRFKYEQSIQDTVKALQTG